MSAALQNILHDHLEKHGEADSQRRKYEHENALLDEQLKNLRIQLRNTPVKELHFARNVSTSLAQYFIIIENNYIFNIFLRTHKKKIK